MITTIDLPDKLIDEAMFLTGVKIKTDVIMLALQELVKRNKTEDYPEHLTISLEDVTAGRVQRFKSVSDLMNALDE